MIPSRSGALSPFTFETACSASTLPGAGAAEATRLAATDRTSLAEADENLKNQQFNRQNFRKSDDKEP
jgi:hypothetical protein